MFHIIRHVVFQIPIMVPDDGRIFMQLFVYVYVCFNNVHMYLTTCILYVHVFCYLHTDSISQLDHLMLEIRQYWKHTLMFKYKETYTNGFWITQLYYSKHSLQYIYVEPYLPFCRSIQWYRPYNSPKIDRQCLHKSSLII